MHSLTIKQVKSPLQQKNELAFPQTHSRTKPRDTLLFFVFCFVMTDQWTTPHIHFREFRDASVNMYMCTGEHATTWVPRPKCKLYVASSSGSQRALLQGRLVWNELLRQRWLLKNMWRNARVHHNQDDAKHQGCGGGGGCTTYFEAICISNKATACQQLDGQLHHGLSAMPS